MQTAFLLATILQILSLPFAPFNEETPVHFVNNLVFYSYGDEVTFRVKLEPSEDLTIEELFLFIEPEGENRSVEEISVNDQGEVIHKINLSEKALRPFATIHYFYAGKLSNQDQFQSSIFEFYYEDNSVEWQRLSNEVFSVNWYGRDITFGQRVLNTALSGLQSAQKYLPMNLEGPVRIYVYDNATQLQEAVQLSKVTWIAGHASPDVGVILISIPPGPEERLELERQIPHEIMHILEYRVVGNRYDQIPTWLIEGLASLAEIYPNPDYGHVLDQAVKAETTLPMKFLCNSFPQDAAGTFLAYAQSDSFLRYLYQKHGSSDIYRLLVIYKDGQGCSEGCETILKKSLTQLEYQWQQEKLGVDAGWFAIKNLLPYILLFSVIIIPAFLITFMYHRSRNINPINQEDLFRTTG